MARQIIDIGIQGNDGTGDSIRESFRKVNDNFAQLFSIFGSGETISFKDLDDTPDSYGPDQLIVTDSEGGVLIAKDLIGGPGVLVDHSDPNQITITTTVGKLSDDESPTMINHLNAGNFGIGNVRPPSNELATAFNNLYGVSITADDFAISKGYADRRYLQTGSSGSRIGGQIRVREEPSNADEYFLTIDYIQGGYLFIGTVGDPPPGHGFNSSINGSPFVYTCDGPTPAHLLTSGTTYYVRYVDNLRLSLYSDPNTAKTDELGTGRLLINIDPEIPKDDPGDGQFRGDEELRDEFYDSSLEGNWASNEALPRYAVVRRQGDSMEGTLFLNDHPGTLLGVGSPNGPDDLQAVTKLYVDSSSFASSVNLFVSNSGSDIQPNVPEEKKGSAFAYAFESLNKACQKAEELIAASLSEPGPYRQRLTYNNGTFESTLSSFDTLSAKNRRLKIFTDSQGVDQGKDFENRDLREGSIIKGIRSGATGLVTEYNDISGDDAIYIVKLLHKRTDITVFETNYVAASALLDLNKNFIAEQTTKYISDKYPAPGFEYDVAKCVRDVKYIVDAVSYDIKYGGNEKTINVAKAYYNGAIPLLPSGQKDETLDAINYIFLLAEQIVQKAVIPAAPDQISFGYRSNEATYTQVTSGNEGEDGSIDLISKLISLVADILNYGPEWSESNPLPTNKYQEFLPGEPLEYGQPVPELHITIRVESGIYYEQLPIRVPPNVSIKGDEFRRCIIRPAPGESLSKWAAVRFYRNDEFDGMTRTYLSSAGATGTTTSDIITVSSTEGLEEGMYLKVISGSGSFNERAQVAELIEGSSTQFRVTINPTANLGPTTIIRGLNTLNLAPTGEHFAYHYLIDPTTNSPTTAARKQNKDMDMFLLNDGTILRNITGQGHGGFMCVLDPTGQIQTKSPYFQTATSLSGSINRQRFAGGMFVDGFCGNLTANVTSGTSGGFSVNLSGLTTRAPQVPCSFFIAGERFQINVLDYDEISGTAVATLDKETPWPTLIANSLALPITGNVGDRYITSDTSKLWVWGGSSWFDTGEVITYPYFIILGTPGNRSMLANDYTQVNDLGYGCVCINNGIAELVSVFSYYCWTSYYSVDGGQIRSVAGNSSYGEYGLRARGRDPNEVPDVVVLGDATMQQAKIYKTGAFASKSVSGESSFYVDNYWYTPFNTSEVEIDHTPKKSSLVSISITNGGTGYAKDQLFTVTGGTVETGKFPADFIVTEVDNGSTGGPGVITKVSISTPGSYVPVSSSTFTNSPVGVWPVVSGALAVTTTGGGSSASFTGTFLGVRAQYEVTTVEKTTVTGSGYNSSGTLVSKPVVKLNLDVGNAASGSQPTLISDLYHGQVVSIRALQKLRFTDVEEVKPVRPSTALEFQGIAGGGQILRTLAYELSDSLGDALPSNQAILSFDSNVEYVLLDVDTVNISAGYGLNAGDTKIAVLTPTSSKLSRINSGELILMWEGRGHEVTGYYDPDTDGPGTPGYIAITTLPLGQGSIEAIGTGLAKGITNVRNTTLRLGLNSGILADITVRISTCRATAHDMLDVGSGGYNSTNYPNNLYGPPEFDPVKTKEVVEETQGRVFYVSTDQNGIFKVGKFFEVDQGTGNVTFNAPITLTDINGLGFKKGTFVTEFSTDATMQDNDSNTVPVESAVRGYIDSRLGLSHDSLTFDPALNIIGPGFLPLNGVRGMTADLNMSGPPGLTATNHRIINLASPTSESDAANKGYVDAQIVNQELSNTYVDTTTSPAKSLNDLLAFNGTQWVNANTSTAGDIESSLSGKNLSLNIKAGVITNNDINASAEIVQSKLLMNSATTRANATGITQADKGLASFDSANFEITNGWVGIKAGGISLSEIQNISAGRILGNITGSPAAPQEITTDDLVESGIDNLVLTTVDSGAAVITRRKNGLLVDSTFGTRLGTAISGTGTISNLPTVNITASSKGRGAVVEVSYAANGYTVVKVLYGGSGYVVGDQLKVLGGLLNGTDVVNDLTFQIEASNLDSGTYFGVQNVSSSAEAESIVRADQNRNLGNISSRFETVYATTFNGNLIGNVTGDVIGNIIGGISGDVVGDLIGDVKAANGATVLDSGTNGSNASFAGSVTGNVTGNLSGSVLTAAQPNITSLGTLTSLSVGGLTFTSISPDVTATGSTQAGAQLLTSTINNVVSGANNGVRLPSVVSLGTRITVRNDTIGPIMIYPQTSAKINLLLENEGYLLPDGAAVDFVYIGVTSNSNPYGQWFTLNATL